MSVKRTGTDDVCRERHGEERSDPMAQLHDEDRRLGYDLVERVQDADASRYVRLSVRPRVRLVKEIADTPVLPRSKMQGNAITDTLRSQTR